MSSTVYLSSSGIVSVRAELEQLTTVERPVVVARITAARELGDLRENAEYETARKEQSILEGRVNQLTVLLRDAVEIEGSSTSHVNSPVRRFSLPRRMRSATAGWVTIFSSWTRTFSSMLAVSSSDGVQC